MRRIKKGDDVIIISGKNKGQRGKVLEFNTKTNRVKIEGANLITKHVKPNPQAGEKGGIVKTEGSLDESNVALYNPATNKADRVYFKILDDGRKVRVFRSNDEIVDVI